MSDEFMNNVGGEQGNANNGIQDYTQPVEQTNQQNTDSQQTSYSYGQTPQQNYSQPDYGQTPQQNYSQPDYSQTSQAGYSQPNYNQNSYSQQNAYQQPYGQPYQQPGMVQKSESTGFGVASLVLGILSIFTFFCCINYLLAIVAIILGIVQLVRSSKKGFAIGGIVTACISIIGASIFWVLASNAAASSYQDDSLFNEYFEEYMQEYMYNNDAF